MPRTISRSQDLADLKRLFSVFPVVALLGARQIGKSTLARRFADTWNGPAHFYDLEDPRDLARLSDPMHELRPLRGLVVLDEVQNRPDLFPTLRVLADRPGRRARFLVLASASQRYLRQSSESLAGRIGFHDLRGLSVEDAGRSHAERLWIRGGYPASYAASTEAASWTWRKSYARSFLDQDLPQFGISIPPATLRRFWSMLAHYHGQTWNSSELARAFGVSDTTVRRWLDVLTATYVVRQLQPWSENVAKRQVKAPKVYVADTGMLHALLDLSTGGAVRGHPKLGASWEWFAMSTVMRRLGADETQCWFWATHQGAELDLLVTHGERRLGFEFKRTVAPALTKSMRIAIEDLRLDSLHVIHAGDRAFSMGDRIRAIPLTRVPIDLKPLKRR